ncbi:MAG: hypothetical protein RSD81_06065 [Pseudomonas sp.]
MSRPQLFTFVSKDAQKYTLMNGVIHDLYTLPLRRPAERTQSSLPTARRPELVRITLPRLLYIQTVLVDGTVIIEDDSFSLGMPTPMEMLEQHALLLQGENEQLQHDLSRARTNIEKLVSINQRQVDQITQLNGKVEQLTWDVSRLHVENTELKNRQLSGCSPTWGGKPPEPYQG